ncbi:MAG: CBS domain-containing protein [bacterium]
MLLFLVLIFLSLSFVMNLVEMSFLNLERTEFQRRLSEKDPSALWIHFLTSYPFLFFLVVIVGIQASLQLANMFFTVWSYPLLTQPLWGSLVSLTYTTFTIIFCETFPQWVGLNMGTHISFLAGGFLNFLFATPPRGKRSFLEFSPPSEEYLMAFAEKAGSAFLLSWVKKVLESSHLPARKLMKPFSEIRMLSEKDPLPVIAIQSIRAGFSRFPVEETISTETPRFLHIKDLISLGKRTRPDGWKDVLRPLPVFPENFPILKLIPHLRGGVHIALLRNQEGRIVGMITLEDILEHFYQIIPAESISQ